MQCSCECCRIDNSDSDGSDEGEEVIGEDEDNEE